MSLIDVDDRTSPESLAPGDDPFSASGDIPTRVGGDEDELSDPFHIPQDNLPMYERTASAALSSSSLLRQVASLSLPRDTLSRWVRAVKLPL